MPSLSATPTRTASSGRRRPRHSMGMADSQAQLCGAVAARRLARSIWFMCARRLSRRCLEAASSSVRCVRARSGLSLGHWLPVKVPVAGQVGRSVAVGAAVNGTDQVTQCFHRGDVGSQATSVSCLTPKHPKRNGREACVQESSARCTLQLCDVTSHICSSMARRDSPAM